MKFRAFIWRIIYDIVMNDVQEKIISEVSHIIVIWHPKAGIVKWEETSIARQLLGKRIPVAKNKQAATK
jgi:hypothetical protein